MRKNRFTIDQIIRILAESEAPGNSVAATARKYGISEQTIYRWRQKYKGLSASEAKRLKALENENARLKKLLAEKELEIQTFTELIKKLLNLKEKAMFAEKIIQISKKISPKGLSLNTVLKRLQISRSSFYYQRKKKINSEEKLLRKKIKELAMTYKT